MSKVKSSLEEKWVNDEPVFTRVTNADMICVDCINRYDKPAFCSAYPNMKPADVLLGKENAKCEFYTKEK